MGGEQDMRRMGGLKKYLPVTYATMMIGTLAIAGIPPLAGFFSKDEILFKTFISHRVLWSLAVVTALMTAFYMFRLMTMTFFGPYRGPAWDHGAGGAHGAGAAGGHGHDAAHGGHGAHGHDAAKAHGDDHGHGAWHGPHESPTPMTYPLMALAAGAVVVGFFGIPAALGGGNAIEHFLEPSFTASHTAPAEHAAEPAAAAAGETAEHAAEGGHAAEHPSAAFEIGLMVFSVLIALLGIGLAWKFYVTSPEISDQLAQQFAGPHQLLSNKYYVDELYNSTFIAGTMASGRGLWQVDKTVVDGAVNGTGWVTMFAAWLSGLTDRTVVDGAVNSVGWTTTESSYWFRRVQTGLVQNYALLMLVGVFLFVGVYLIAR
jgi:NADH-quinone oxidoreductase subunit L